MNVKETTIQRTILDGLAKMGYCVWRNQQIPPPIRRGKKIIGLRRADPHTVGLPDILMIEPRTGRLVGIEVKSEKGKQSEEQKIWEQRFIANGAKYILAKCWEDVAKIL